MPAARQLCTVEVGVLIIRETALVPPSASISLDQGVSMRLNIR